MTEKKTPDSQLRATQEWRNKNKQRNRLLSYRSSARLFVRKYATKNEMQELNDLFNEENPNAKL